MSPPVATDVRSVVMIVAIMIFVTPICRILYRDEDLRYVERTRPNIGLTIGFHWRSGENRTPDP